MKRYNLQRLFATAVCLLFVACVTPEEKPTEDPTPAPEPPVEGTSLVSGEPLVATLNGGLAPFTLGQNISHRVVGIIGGGEENSHPDLVVEGCGGVDNSGLQVAQFVRTASDGRLIYTAGEKISTHPWKVGEESLKVAEVDGAIVAFTFAKGSLQVAHYDASAKSFGREYTQNVAIDGVPQDVAAIEVVGEDGESVTLLLLGLTVVAEDPEMDDVTHSYYNTLGTYRGVMSVGALWRVTLAKESFAPVSAAELVGPERLIISPSAVCAVGEEGYVVANMFGAMKLVGADGKVSQPITTEGDALRNRSVVEALEVLPDGSFIASGEGSMWHYTQQKEGGAWSSAEIVMESGRLYGGSMSVPNVVDWDGDGTLDVVVGNSAGNLLFFRNRGTNQLPAFGEGEYLLSCGEVAEIRAGYYCIGGPQESGWGYICPTVIDWDGDGVMDVVYSFNEGILEVMRGVRGVGTPQLGRREKITLDNMEIAGMWRVRPAVAKVDGRTLLLTMDTEDRVHLYERRIDNAVVDRGIVTLNFSSPITGYRSWVEESLAERGFEKLHLMDWDADGDLDLLVGVPITASFPEPTKGLPWSRNPAKGLNVLFLENIGSNTEMSFAYPRQLLFKGKDLNLGTLSITPTQCGLGDVSGGDNLLVGCDNGALYFFSHKDLSRSVTLW